MPKLPRIRASEVIGVLKRLGFVQVRQRDFKLYEVQTVYCFYY